MGLFRGPDVDGCDPSGFSKAQATGEGQENNCEATEGGDISDVEEHVKEGGEGEPVALRGRLDRQTGAAGRQPPPGGRNVPGKASKVVQELKSRKSATEGI